MYERTPVTKMKQTLAAARNRVARFKAKAEDAEREVRELTARICEMEGAK